MQGWRVIFFTTAGVAAGATLAVLFGGIEPRSLRPKEKVYIHLTAATFATFGLRCSELPVYPRNQRPCLLHVSHKPALEHRKTSKILGMPWIICCDSIYSFSVGIQMPLNVPCDPIHSFS